MFTFLLKFHESSLAAYLKLAGVSGPLIMIPAVLAEDSLVASLANVMVRSAVSITVALIIVVSPAISRLPVTCRSAKVGLSVVASACGIFVRLL